MTGSMVRVHHRPPFMTITPHFLVGAALATTTNNPAVAFSLGVLSHPLLDAIPHLDPGTLIKINLDKNERWPIWVYVITFLEFFIMIVLFYWLFSGCKDFGILLWGGFGGLAIDILDNHPINQTKKWPGFKQLHYFHEFMHINIPREKWYWGLITTIILAGGALWYLLKYSF